MAEIYLIKSPSNKVYIGQTSNIKRRLSQYKGGHCKNQIALYNSIKKYSWNNHSFIVLTTLPADIQQDILNIYEQLYMDFYKDSGHILMNLKGAGSTGKLSDSTKIKMGNSRRGKSHSEETKKKMMGREVSDTERIRMSERQNHRKVPVVQKSLTGEFIKEWPSIFKAAHTLKIDISTLRKVCIGLKYRKSAGGFNWSLKNK